MGTDGGIRLVHCGNFEQEMWAERVVDRGTEAVILELIEDPLQDVAEKGVRICDPTRGFGLKELERG